MISRCTCLIVLLLAATAHRAHAQEVPIGGPGQSWYETLDQRLGAFGHRNWIAIVDSAYPAQTSPGVETIVTRTEHLVVVQKVLARLSQSRHVRPVIYLDAELEHVAEADAAGIDDLRVDLNELLPAEGVTRLPHAEIIDRLDAAGEKFHVLVLKTTLALPYTSVFIELDCGYWSPEAEERLRRAMDVSR
jgi:hypothetical protein